MNCGACKKCNGDNLVPELVKANFDDEPHLILSLTEAYACQTIRGDTRTAFESSDPVDAEFCARADKFGQIRIALPTRDTSITNVVVTLSIACGCRTAKQIVCEYASPARLLQCDAPPTSVTPSSSLLACTADGLVKGPLRCTVTGTVAAEDAFVVCGDDGLFAARELSDAGTTIDCTSVEFVLALGGEYTRRMLPPANRAISTQERVLACDHVDGKLKLFGVPGSASAAPLCSLFATSSVSPSFLTLSSNTTVDVDSSQMLLSFTAVNTEPANCIAIAASTPEGATTFRILQEGIYRLTGMFAYRRSHAFASVNTDVPLQSSAYVAAGFELNADVPARYVGSKGNEYLYGFGFADAFPSQEGQWATENLFEQIPLEFVRTFTANETISMVVGHRLLSKANGFGNDSYGVVATTLTYNATLGTAQAQDLPSFVNKPVASYILIERLG